MPLVAVGFYFFVVRGAQFFLVPSRSMEPALAPGDRIVTLRQAAYRKGDIVVVPDPAERGSYLVKRIVGLGGDAIGVRNGALFLDGAYASEPYLPEPMLYALDPPALVPADHAYLLGDNRNNSDDSHDKGMTWPTGEVVGRVVWRYYPFARWGGIPAFPLRSVLEY